MTDQAIPEPPLRWLFLDLNSYFASCEQQLQPRLRGKPVAVAPVDSEYTCAIAASAEAKKFGIKTGTIIAEAREKCPGLIVVNARHDEYVKFHHRIVEEVWNHIPVTAVCSIDEVACRLIGRERRPEYAMDLARRIKQGIRARVGECLTCSVGIAPTKLLAKIGSDMQKPDGLTVLESHDLPGKLLPLKLADLPGIGWNMVRRLEERQVPDIATLWNLQPKQAKAIWGSIEGERFWYALHGFDLPERETKRSSIGHSHVLASVMRTLPAARLVARRLLLKAATRLRRMDYAASALVLHAQFENSVKSSMWGARRSWSDEQGWADDTRLAPTQDSAALLATLDELWNGLERDHAGRRIKAVGVVLHGLCPIGAVMPDLFAAIIRPGAAPPRGVNLFNAVDRINKKYGQDTVALGVLPGQIAKYVGAKIAFNRIPDMAEFDE